jgi:hypothetical protein
LLAVRYCLNSVLDEGRDEKEAVSLGLQKIQPLDSFALGRGN